MKQPFTQKAAVLIAIMGAVLSGSSVKAQTFTQMSPYDTINVTPQTLYWNIINPDTVAWGTASLTVYYDGDFGASVEFITIYGENNYQIGVTLPNAQSNDCMLDSVTLTFPASLINTWAADDTLKFSGVTTSDVDYFCTNNHVRVKLAYNYCSPGPVATMSMPSTSFCSIDPMVPITTAPSGGTLSGPGVSGNNFDPAGLLPGTYTITYTYTNGSGCTSMETVSVIIGSAPAVTASNDTVCPFNSVILTADGNGHIVWYSDATLNTPVDTGNTMSTPALFSTTTYYAATTLMDNYFVMTGMGTGNSATVDHDGITGDDRGGIAVTMNYVYVVGDDSVARYDLNLGNGMNYPRNDGLFSDLGSGQLYTLYNPINGIPDANAFNSMYVTQIRELNADLTLGTGVITLSDSIQFGYDPNYDLSGIFAGNGFVVIYSKPSSRWYVVDLQDGVVTDLGSLSNSGFGFSENWSVWGIAEFDGTAYSVLYRDQIDANIHRRVLPAGAPTTAYTFTDLSDMASFTYAPWNNRWYLHYEGSAQFGGTSETLVYATASDSTGSEVSATVDCPAPVTVVVELCTGVEEHVNGSISIAPNPNNGLFTITVSTIMDAKVEIISMEGRLVYSDMFGGGARVKALDLSPLASGVYYVRISNDTIVKTAKLIKQ